MADPGSSSSTTGALAVLLPLPLPEPFDYLPPDDQTPPVPGALVRVPFGNRERIGVVWGPGGGAVEPARLKRIAEIIDLPPLTDELRQTVDWVSRYTLASPGSVLRMVLSVPAALDPPKPSAAYALGDRRPARLTAQRRRVLDYLADGKPKTTADIRRAAGVGAGVLRGLADGGQLRRVELARAESWPCPDPDRPGLALSSDQAAAAADLTARLAADRFSVALLDGVTGSGKTEVYFEAIAAAVHAGRQALVLLPEIALGAQWLTRFERRFGAPPAEWHSDLGTSQRRRTWRAVATGQARVVVGARSALFLPFGRLGAIVVDEEHDASFKQEDGVIYNARDMAVVRAQAAGIPIVLASATPSLETHNNTVAGRYDRLALPERHGAELPTIELVDMRAAALPRDRWLSPLLVDAVAQAGRRGEQALLFLNRRGYAPLTLCRACGYRIHCPNCSSWLVAHRFSASLRCHHCDFEMTEPAACPSCEVPGAMIACGPGVERLADEIQDLFPHARVAQMTSDTMTGPGTVAGLVAAMQDGALDILIGTQMVTKGHHFPSLTVVGVIDADLGLAGGDLRAAERTFQLLSQVAGRAGRAERPGRVLVQTYAPEHPVLHALAAGDRDGFVAAETAARHEAGMPPFGRLAALILSGPREGEVRATAQQFAGRAPNQPDFVVLGPAPAPLTLLRGRYRYRLLVKARREINLSDRLRRWLAGVQLPRAVRLQVDIDPYSFL